MTSNGLLIAKPRFPLSMVIFICWAVPDFADLFTADARFSDDLADELATGTGATVVWSVIFRFGRATRR